eukprot:NODE_91_length_21779_cov_0.171356.p10 type:complete len:197 gc:universal NODE_91_length_21779_cov_0.171356:3049-2459(-)
MNLLLTAHPDDECMFFAPTMHLITHIYCLSNGNDSGIGKVREKEFLSSCDEYQVNGTIGPLVDGEDWDNEEIVALVKAFGTSNIISNIFTFDSYGVSGHKNHISIYEAMISSGITFYSLTSVPLYRKYIGILDLALVFMFSNYSSRKVYCAFPSQTIKGYISMSKHQSQLVWFRYLYLVFSRYMFINEFTLHNASK